MNSVKMVVERWISVSTKQMVGDAASMESPVNMRTAALKKKKVPIRKIPVSLAPLPNIKAVRSKKVARDNVGYKPGGSHVKMYTQKLYREDQRSR
jgi:hypothetical protein